MTSLNTRRLDFSDVSLYWVTPDFTDTNKILKITEQALDGGVDVIQLRSKSLSDRNLFEAGKKIQELCRKTNALFMVNNRVDLLLALDADGVHIGHEDLPPAFIRETIGHRRILGISTHSLPQAIEAQKNGADYVSCGPIWATPTKPDYPAVGLGLIGFYRAALKIPYVIIGGINQSNIDQIVQAGGKTVAVVRAIYDAPNPTEVAKNLKQKIQVNRVQTVI
ncbi:MAG: thiamine phosphate synthase [Elusimicrobiota bacterium]